MYPAYRTVAVGGIALLISLVLAVLFAILLWYVFRALRGSYGSRERCHMRGAPLCCDALY